MSKRKLYIESRVQNKRRYSWTNFLDILVHLGTQIQCYVGCEFSLCTTCKQLRFVSSAVHPKLSRFIIGSYPAWARFKLLYTFTSLYWCSSLKPYFPLDNIDVDNEDYESSSKFTTMFFVYGVDKPMELIIRLEIEIEDTVNMNIKLQSCQVDPKHGTLCKLLHMVQEITYWNAHPKTSIVVFDIRSVCQNNIKAVLAPILYTCIFDRMHDISIGIFLSQNSKITRENNDMFNDMNCRMKLIRQKQLQSELLNGVSDQFVVPCTNIKKWEKSVFQQ